ncbi:SIS domain-containing protein, partial [Breznakiellaceae bacterium SP9]
MIAFFQKQQETIKDSLESLSEALFKELAGNCVEALKKGGKIIACGLGKNVPVCEKFVGTMNSLGLDARFLHINSAVHGDLGLVNPGDLVLLLSKSGNTSESAELAGYLDKRGTETWLLSFCGESRLASMLRRRIILRLAEEGDPWNIVPNNSTLIFMMLLQGLALEIAAEMQVSLSRFKENHPGGGIG